jgi:stringent starvation protein B
LSETSTKPYLIRAIYEWCVDNGYTPYLTVFVDRHTLVPQEYVKNGEIVLNISPLATHELELSNDRITFQARFNGRVKDLSVPVDNVLGLYAREIGQGMSFEFVPHAEPDQENTESKFDDGISPEADKVQSPKSKPKRTLKSVAFESLAVDDAQHKKSGVDASDDGPDTTPPSTNPGKPRLTRIK